MSALGANHTGDRIIILHGSVDSIVTRFAILFATANDVRVPTAVPNGSDTPGSRVHDKTPFSVLQPMPTLKSTNLAEELLAKNLNLSKKTCSERRCKKHRTAPSKRSNRDVLHSLGPLRIRTLRHDNASQDKKKRTKHASRSRAQEYIVPHPVLLLV